MSRNGPVLVLAAVAILSAPAVAQIAPPPEIPFDGGDAGVEYLEYFGKGDAPAGKMPYHIGPDAGQQVHYYGGETWMEWVSWLAAEREPDKWDWDLYSRDRVTCHIHDIGLEALLIPQFPPKWYWDSTDCVPLQCLEHGEKVYCLSIWAPSTLKAYERFFRAAAEMFRQHRHKFDRIRIPITGDYGEGNFPLGIWVVPPLHCHPGWWCGDPYARADFREAMLRKYGDLAALNAAWGTRFAAAEKIVYPPQPGKGRYGLDFVHWYHDSLTAFAEKSINLCRAIFPDYRLRCGLGGGWPNSYWGMDYSGMARMASDKGIMAHPCAMSGHPFYTMAFASAYNFYGVPMSTEAAGKLTAEEVLDRIFMEIGAPSAGYYDYGENYGRGKQYLDKYAHLFGTCGDPIRKVAVFVPTTTAYTHCPGGLASLSATIDGAQGLRDISDFDVIDERMALDGALKGHRVLIVFELETIEEPVVKAISDWVSDGGILIAPQAAKPIVTPENQISAWNALLREPGPLGDQTPTVQTLWTQCGKQVGTGGSYCLPAPHNRGKAYLDGIGRILYACPGLPVADPDFDNVYLTIMTDRVLLLNRGAQPVTKNLSRYGAALAGVLPWAPAALAQPVEVPPKSIVALGPGRPPTVGLLRRVREVAPGIPQQSSELPTARMGESLLPVDFALDAAHVEGVAPESVKPDGIQINETWLSPKGLSARDYIASVCFRADDPFGRPELRIRYQNEQTYYCITFDGTRHWSYLTWAVGDQRKTLQPGWAYWASGQWYHLAMAACGPELSVYLNGVCLASARHEGVGEGSVRIGALAGKVTFRDLQVRALKPTATP